jgi:uncharacterized membrane protein
MPMIAIHTIVIEKKEEYLRFHLCHSLQLCSIVMVEIAIPALVQFLIYSGGVLSIRVYMKPVFRESCP